MNIRERIKDLAKEVLGAELREEEDLRESGVDSLGLVSLIVAVEEAFGLTFCDNDLQPERLKTLSDLTELTEKYQ